MCARACLCACVWFDATPCRLGNPCDTGHFKTTNDGSACSVKRTTCAKGYYFVASGVLTADNVCKACSGTTFNDAVDASTSCTQKTAVCGPGYYLITSGTFSADNVCKECAANTYKSGTNDGDMCLAKTSVCDAGSHLVIDDKTEDNECVTCPEDTFNPSKGSDETCTAKVLSCNAGSYFTASGLSTADNTCTQVHVYHHTPGSLHYAWPASFQKSDVCRHLWVWV